MPAREISADRQQELFDHTLRSRTLLRPELPEPHLFDNTALVYRNGEFLPSGCPHERTDFPERVVNYDWSDEHQFQFEETLHHANFNIGRLHTSIAEYGWHWANALSDWGINGRAKTPWLEPFAPGISDLLHDLGKRPAFRTLTTTDYPHRNATFYYDPETGDVTVGRDGPERTTVDAQHRADLIARRGMAEYVGEHFEFVPDTQKTCVLCGGSYWPQTLTEQFISRFGQPRYCPVCLISSSLNVDPWSIAGVEDGWGREAAIDAVHVFMQLTGVFPSSLIKRQSIAYADDDARDRWVTAVMLLPGRDSVKRYFGDWISMLAAADIIDEKKRRGQSGYTSVANDGHVALSAAERTICDYLHANGVAHDKEPFYPDDPELNPNGKLRADWRIGDQLVEYAGRMDDAKYAEKLSRKEQLAERHGIDLLVLLPADVRRLELVAQRHWLRQ